MNFLVRLIVNALALCAAAFLINGIDLVGISPELNPSGHWVNILIVALVFGLVNAFIKPITKILSFPLILVTLGLFTMVVNAAMLGLTGWFSNSLNVDGFVPALLGGIVISIVSTLLGNIFDDDKRAQRAREAKRKQARRS